jgi:hypothetical protein
MTMMLTKKRKRGKRVGQLRARGFLMGRNVLVDYYLYKES